jgi:hypothetical protein
MASRAFPYLLIPLAVALAYAAAVPHPFVWDDPLTILENPAVREARWGEIVSRPTGSYVRPVVFATFALDLEASGPSPAALRLTNLALHAAAACLLLAAAVALGTARPLALATALLFALHPVQTEAVTYVSGRTDLLAAVFSLGALILHARGHGWDGKPGRRAALGGALLLYALALGSKESAVALPLALLCGDRVFAERTGRSRRADLGSILPYLALLALYVLWRAGRDGGALAIGDFPGSTEGWAAVLAAAASYARLLLFPVNLHLERFVAGAAPSALLGLVVIAAGAWALRRGSPAVRFWILWAAVAYLPTANLLRVYPGLPPGTVFAAEHFLYLPSTGLLAALILAAAPRLRARPSVAGFLAVLLCFAFLLQDRNRDWRDEETLYRHTLRFTPESARVRLNLGNLYLARGDLARAADTYREGLRHHPADPDLLTNAGLAALALGRLGEAEAALRQVVAIQPGEAQAWANLGALLATAGRTAEARHAYGRALHRDPANADARAGLRFLDRAPGIPE